MANRVDGDGENDKAGLLLTAVLEVEDAITSRTLTPGTATLPYRNPPSAGHGQVLQRPRINRRLELL